MCAPEVSKRLKAFLLEFGLWCKAFPGEISNSVCFEGKSANTSNKAFKHAVIVFMQHGDEWGTLPAVLDILPWLKYSLPHALINTKVTVILGNPKAAAICSRWLDSDLNRCFPSPNHFESAFVRSASPNAIATFESTRAKEIASVIATADMVLDLHQTSQPVREPFFIFPFHKASVTLAQQMGTARVLITRDMGEKHGQERCIDDFAQALNIPTVAIEVGQKGDNPMSRKHADDAIRCFVRLSAEETSRKEMTKKLRLLHISRRYRFATRADKVAEGLVNLSPVHYGAPLIYGAEIITAPRDGYVVFMQDPPRDESGMIVGAMPQSAISFVENYVVSDIEVLA